MKRLIGILMGLVLIVWVAPAQARPGPEDFQRATRIVLGLAEAAQTTPGASPAMAVIAVPASGEPVVWVNGRLDASLGGAADRDSPFYIASMTKAYVGLLAARLDARGVLPLETTLAEIWPELALPGGDAAKITLAQLLSHQAPITNEALTFRTAYVDDVPARDYPRLLALASAVRPAGFEYDNLGYLIYAAALEARTGRNWRDWLNSEILVPMGLKRTSAFSSRFAAGSVTAGHQWTGQDWSITPVKPDALMHAAGGLVTSPGDMALWLRAELDGSAGPLGPEIFAKTRTPLAMAPVDQDGITCSGYALGWSVCHLGAADVFTHGGAYTGFRSAMGFSRELGAGVAVLTNSDSMTGGLSANLIKIFFSALADPGYVAPEPAAFAAQYQARVAKLVANRRAAAEKARADASWGGWLWRPTPDQLQAYVGRYRSAKLGEVTVSLRGGQLMVRLGQMEAALEPAKTDLFGTVKGVLAAPEAVSFTRDARGGVAKLNWSGDTFERVG